MYLECFFFQKCAFKYVYPMGILELVLEIVVAHRYVKDSILAGIYQNITYNTTERIWVGWTPMLLRLMKPISKFFIQQKPCYI